MPHATMPHAINQYTDIVLNLYAKYMDRILM